MGRIYLSANGNKPGVTSGRKQMLIQSVIVIVIFFLFFDGRRALMTIDGQLIVPIQREFTGISKQVSASSDDRFGNNALLCYMMSDTDG